MEPLIGQIVLYGGNFAPRGWAFCDGQLLEIEENESLFAILGTTYGGDGRKTFGLPDLRGRVPMHAGQGHGLSHREIGQKVGVEGVALTATELPEHRHELLVSNATADTGDAEGRALARSEIYANTTDPSQDPTTALSSKTVGLTGGSAPHENMQPTLCINYIIAIQGAFPSRS